MLLHGSCHPAWLSAQYAYKTTVGLNAAWALHRTFTFPILIDRRYIPLSATSASAHKSCIEPFLIAILSSTITFTSVFFDSSMDTSGLNIYATVNGTSTQNDDRETPYGYTPTLYVCILFVALYGVTTILHVLQAGWSRLWWLFPTAVLAGITEVIGWSGRLWSSINPHAVDPYLMQSSTPPPIAI
ncbi:hypothetical protein NUW54_g12851 [Trametes sanguinea]|uniref:Uncharacterized protein n=1 Tax=Trametes sanguinea TaxID=158606 RepID=A0ACC1MSH9_9APHY|nr:hypothetical protein NUW54_g12851 [Trametes sanguinea]